MHLVTVSIPNGPPTPFRLANQVFNTHGPVPFQSPTGLPRHFDASDCSTKLTIRQVSIPNGPPTPFRRFGTSMLPPIALVSIPNGPPTPFRLFCNIIW